MMTEIVLVQKVVSKVFGDFVSKVVSDGVDVLKSAIKDADLDRKSYNQNLQTRLYQLIVDALNRFTYNKYEKQDKLYDAAESILKGYISTKDNTDAVKSGLKMLASGVNNDTCQEFLETLCGEICRDENSDLYKEIDMLWKRRESEYIRGEFEKSNQYDREVLGKLNDLKEVLEFLKENINGQEGSKTEHYEIPIENRAKEYAGKWDKNVFLNNFNEEDENARVNIKLSEIYIEECLPNYIWRTNKQSKNTLRNLLAKYIININNRKMLLILGQPGIGKSTLITWIMANLVEKKENILVYQFASDLKSVNWQGNDILKDIFKALGFRYGKLENRILILDGFDEINAGGERERILNKLNQELAEMNILKNFSLIITCRENYVYKLEKIECDFITLQTWDDDQIKSFCMIYGKKSTNIVSENKIDRILENKEVFGIPLILYMVLALDISIEKSESLVDVYNQIFSLDRSSIYDRCIQNSRYGQDHRISEFKIKQQIHQISQRIAFWIFENNSEKEFIIPREYEEICNSVIGDISDGNEEIKRDFLIGNYFKLIKHCEGMETQELHFIHRSIYEYFVVVYFFESLCNLKSKEEVAGKIGELLKDGRLSKQILKFIKYKFNKIKKYNLGDITKEVFNVMLRDGMTYYFIKEQKEPLLNIIKREMNIFTNMLEVVHLWNQYLGKVDNKITIYLQCNRESDLNLIGADLIEADLSGADLIEADLSGANLSGADLIEANLSKADLSGANLIGANLIETDLIEAYLIEADLSGADLSGAYLGGAYLGGANLSEANLIGADLIEADLSGANLSGANLSEANLSKTIFDESQINILHKKYDLSESRVYLSETDELISYQEYCIREQKK